MNPFTLSLSLLLLALLYWLVMLYLQQNVFGSSAAAAIGALFLMGFWSLTAGLALALPEPEQKKLILHLSYIPQALLPGFWFLVISDLCRGRKDVRTPIFFALCSIASAFILGNWLNPGQLFGTSDVVTNAMLSIQPGPLYPIFFGYIYIVIFALLIQLIVFSLQNRCPPLRASALFFAMAVPVGLGMLYRIGMLEIDWTCAGFAVSAVVLLSIYWGGRTSAIPFSSNMFIESMTDGVILVGATGEVTDINEAAQRLLCLEASDAPRRATLLLRDWCVDYEVSQRLIRSMQHPVEGQRYYRLTVWPIRHRKRAAALIILEDDTAYYLAEERIAYLENHDEITGLLNRSYFTKRLKQELDYLAPSGRSAAVLCIAIANFRYYNDTYGNEYGVALQKEVGLRICSALSAHDIIGRFADAEFYLLFNPDRSGETLEGMTQNLADSLNRLFSREPVIVDLSNVLVRLSIGTVLYPRHGKQAEDLIAKAHFARLHAMRPAGNNFNLYRPDIDLAQRRSLRLTRSLETAIENGELRVVYQPQVHSTSGAVTGVEALCRWNSREYGPIPPDEFIPIAEETGLIHKIGLWVLETAVAQGMVWKEMGLRIQISVNVSLNQLTNRDFSGKVIQIVDTSGIDADTLEIELTESLALFPEAMAHSHLEALRNRGIRLAMDDFGMGHSSLTYIKQFPLNTVKIDRALSHDILENDTSVALLRTISVMCTTLRIDTVVEFVETPPQLELLRSLGYHVIQGYVFSPPLEAKACTEYLCQGPHLLKNTHEIRHA